MEFDEHHRKLIIGNSLGQIKVFDILSGVMTHELETHGREERPKASSGVDQRQKDADSR